VLRAHLGKDCCVKAARPLRVAAVWPAEGMSSTRPKVVKPPMGAILALSLVWGPTGAKTLQLEAATFAFTCAAFPADLSEADLIARYGPGHVIKAPVFGSDDGPQNGTALFSQTDDRRLEIVWQNEESRSSPRWVKAVGSRWTTANGITIGTTLLAIERANGRPFRLAGFQTESQGRLLSWEHGRLGHPHDPDGCGVSIQFQPSYDGTENFDLVRQVRSGREYSSGHPALQKLNPRVVAMWLAHSRR
jgi:hypothetical protein